MIDHWGWTMALSLNVATSLVSVVAPLSIRYVARPRVAHAGALTPGDYLRQVGEGWKTVRTSPRVGVALTTLGAVWLAGGFLPGAGDLPIQHAARNPGVESLGGPLAGVG